MSGGYEIIVEKRGQTAPTLSVVVPLFNVAGTVAETLATVLVAAESLSGEIEVILVDDGSTDDSLERGLAVLKDANVDYVVLRGQNGGVSRARNRGFRQARGYYVHFLDADDLVESGMYARCASRPGFDVAFTGFVDEIPRKSSGRYRDPGSSASSRAILAGFLLERRSLWLGATIFRSGHLEETATIFPPGIRNGEDQYFICRALLAAQTALTVRDPMVRHLLWPTSVTATKKASAFDSYLIHRRFDRHVRSVPAPGCIRRASHLKRGRELIRMVRWSRSTPLLYRLVRALPFEERLDSAVHGAAHAAVNRALPHVISSINLLVPRFPRKERHN